MTVHPVETSIRDEVAERDAQERVARDSTDRAGVFALLLRAPYATTFSTRPRRAAS